MKDESNVDGTIISILGLDVCVASIVRFSSGMGKALTMSTKKLSLQKY